MTSPSAVEARWGDALGMGHANSGRCWVPSDMALSRMPMPGEMVPPMWWPCLTKSTVTQVPTSTTSQFPRGSALGTAP